jgi:hypothetical protein
MKKLVILVLVIFSVSSCSLFEKPSMTQEEIDAIIAQKANVEEELANVKQELDLLKLRAEECAKLLDEATKKPALNGNYFVIAGSFKNMNYAKDFSEKIKKMGGSGEIIDGPYNFNLVVYTAHQTLRDAAESMYLARTNVADEAWVYQKK